MHPSACPDEGTFEPDPRGRLALLWHGWLHGAVGAISQAADRPRLLVAVRNPGAPAAFSLVIALRGRVCKPSAQPAPELAGVAVAAVGGDRAWVMRISLAPEWRRRGIGSAMLRELERRLVAAGVHRIQCLLAGESDIGALALEHAGYAGRRGMVLYERLEPVDPGSAGILGQLGGQIVRAGAWDQLGGMAGENSAAWPGRRS